MFTIEVEGGGEDPVKLTTPDPVATVVQSYVSVKVCPLLMLKLEIFLM